MNYNLSKFLSLIAIVLINLSCETKEVLYQAADFAYVGEFTRGLEGPAVDKYGNLYFVNPHKNGSIGKVDTNGNFTVFIDQLPNNSVANGIRFGKNQEMFLADYTGHNVLIIEKDEKIASVYANDSTINQPNDLAICCDNLLFASDPSWKTSTGNLLRIKDGEITYLERDMGTTNGIEVSPDETKLYVNESVQKNIWVYDLDSNGNISNKKLFYSFEDHGLDGMRCDNQGNLYVTRHGKGTIVKLSSKGELLREIKLKGKKPSNLAFGGNDGKTIYVTLQDRGYIESFRVENAGRTFNQSLLGSLNYIVTSATSSSATYD